MTAKDDAERLVDRMAAESGADRARKVEAQFADKLARLEASGDAPAELIERLRVLWKMFHAGEDQVPWTSRALIMAALGYFVSPFDMIPDVAGKAGYLDDKMIVNVVWTRLGELTTAFAD